MNLESLQSRESFRLFLKSIYDSVTNATSIAQSAANTYSDLQDSYDKNVVISQEQNGRQNQNINIATTFGDDIGGLFSKEFRFLYGSTLKYDRVLPIDHNDTSEVVNLETLINALSSNSGTFLKNSGDTAIGSYTFNADLSLPSTTITLDGVGLSLGIGGDTAIVGPEATAITNRSFIENLIAGLTPSTPGTTITVGSGSTSNNGFVLLGTDLAIAWVTGPSTFFSGTTNPLVTLNTSITFDIIYSYSLSTENSEVTAIDDNDAWWQMCEGYAGNTFPIICQAIGGSLAGWLIPKLIVIGKPVNMALTATTPDKTIMEANGQTYPMLVYVSLTATGGVAPMTWQMITTLYSAQLAAGYSNILQISAPSTGTFPISVKVTDSLGATSDQTINIIINPYQLVALNITSVDTNIIADYYPFLSTYLMESSGGEAPITWSVLDHGTLTVAPTITSGDILNLSFQAAGTYAVTIQATDSAATPQIVSKVINFTVSNYVPPPPPPCFESDQTYVLMNDGSGKLLKDMKAGDKILTISETCIKSKILTVIETTVTGVILRNPSNQNDTITLNNIIATLTHPWATINNPNGNLWIRTNEIISSTELIEVILNNDNKYTCKLVTPESIIKTGAMRIAGNLSTLASTYCVGSTANGPWFVVHNLISNLC